MRRATQEKFNKMLIAMGEAYGVADPRQNFTATEPMAQSLNDKVQESSEFLQQISIIPVEDIKGEVLTTTIASTLAKRTAVAANNPRKATVASGPTDRKYECKMTEFDVAITYALMDMWARYGDYHARYMNAVYQRIALDRILIGWKGMSAANETDRATNPDLSDVNLGWIYDLMTNKPANFLIEGSKVEDKIVLAADGDYTNIDQMVYDVGSLIPDVKRTGKEVALIGRGLVSHDMNKVLGQYGEQPSEKIHFEILAKSFGGYKSIFVPGFHEYGVLVTDPKNLQIYWQKSSLRRQVENQPAFNQIVDFISQNEAYMIGDLDAAAGIKGENVVFALPPA